MVPLDFDSFYHGTADRVGPLGLLPVYNLAGHEGDNTLSYGMGYQVYQHDQSIVYLSIRHDNSLTRVLKASA